ncbi:AEC family transporter [Epibacterium sp. SM1969]|uniref:AEC family transporter n=1 Tax=Tritonibacter aquimaris TaxID=2663379 RepID=A0A844B2R6_9RHOB|nr:AEC family transporter [Tritonibacter aquimaris]MQY44371.1 AEC family transporter [Tritonibacter aquimaris]
MLSTLINVIAPVFLVVGAGYATTRAGMFQQSHIDGLMAFTQKFAIPCLLFGAIAHLDLSQGFSLPLLSSFYIGAFSCFLLGLFGAKILFGRPWTDATAIGFCCLFSNSVLLGLPITERAFGVDALAGNYMIIAFHSPFCYGIGITVMEIVRNQGAGLFQTIKRVLTAMFKNALIVGIALGFVVNLSGVVIPAVFDEALSLLTRAALPAALFALGGVLTQYRPEGDMRVILYVCALSLLVHPLIVMSLGSLQGLDATLLRSGVMNAAMATGINGYIFANMYGCAKRVAASAVLLATGLSALTVWMWISVL